MNRTELNTSIVIHPTSLHTIQQCLRSFVRSFVRPSVRLSVHDIHHNAIFNSIPAVRLEPCPIKILVKVSYFPPEIYVRENRSPLINLRSPGFKYDSSPRRSAQPFFAILTIPFRCFCHKVKLASIPNNEKQGERDKERKDSPFPLGATFNPTHSKWNHSLGQPSPSQATISP